MDKFTDILQQAKLTDEDIDALQKIIVPINVKTNKTLINYGDKCTSIYFILKGGFAMQLLKEDGTEKTINFFLDSFQPFMTIPQSYFQETKSTFKLLAVKNSNILAFSKIDLLQTIENSAAIKDFYQSQIILALLSELDFRTKLLTYSPKRMYELLISDYQEVIKNVSSRHIANFIGISPEWLSNLKRTL
ncbi:MAG: Crp/Fnr family transcriptional regulator [Saprospiraceae bacterium]|jgi:CRP-like cAMP-binding protein|nr:Crp/Fnr family transcriptional regulator [Saprospiraceae bacterium]